MTVHKNIPLKQVKRFLLLAAFAITLLSGVRYTIYAETVYTNPDTGYVVNLRDDADLLTDEQEQGLAAQMESITAYGSVAFVSIDHNSYGSTASYARSYTDSNFYGSTGTVFVIDMDNREIYIDTTGSMRKQLTSAYARTITDNVYTYASDANYYECAVQAFSQIYTLLEGGHIAQPMKYISNALLALVIALLINFIIVMIMSNKHRPSRSQLLEGIYTKCELEDAHMTFVNQTKVYDPPQSSGGGGGGGGGHSGGGGGHSGGGHSF